MSELWKNMDEARVLLSSPLFANKYIGIITGSGDKSSKVFTDSNFGYMMSNISFPQFTYNAKEHNIGGVNVSVINLFEQGQLEITVYNTGKEFNTIYQWGEIHYNQKTRCYGYLEDIFAELKIYEYDRAANKILEHRFHKCTLYTYGNVTLSYEEAQQVETFQMGVKYVSYELIKHSNSTQHIEHNDKDHIYPGGWMV